jgi:hypothetical protein
VVGVFMPYEYVLTLIINETGEKVSQKGFFQADAWNSLNDFVEYADDLINTKFVKDGMPASLKINFEKNSGMAVSTKLPDWNDVTVFLHKFRPIGLEKESTYFYKICSILTKELTHSYFRNMVDEQRDIYSGKRMQATFQIRSNDVILNSEKVLYDWLNSYEYHRDKNKRQFIDSLHAILPLDASKVIFLRLLSDKTIAIHNIAALVRVVVGKQESLEIQMRFINCFF